ncbi:Keratin, type II cytoskeletal 8 [Tupaia chinensis]|uniref:Keratin, type II cytoskeletal 8 n=1 Tax=Tupaia chinensis TaxID=246437 RepID=L9KKQ2_TUPCH|nr:Keratin, type II cytoskeletal 8 [Tupaia chinensis]
MSIRVTQKSCKVSASGTRSPFSSCLQMSAPDTHISSSGFYQVDSSSDFWGDLVFGLSLHLGYGFAVGVGGITAIMVNQSLLNFFKLELNEEEIHKLQSQISDTSVVLSMNSSRSMNMDGIINEVRAQYEETAHCSQAEAEGTYQIKYKKLQSLARKHRHDLHHTKTEISEKNQNIDHLQAEIKRSKIRELLWRPDVEQHAELAIKDANTRLAEQEGAL